jgi:signal transduction histidine kinase
MHQRVYRAWLLLTLLAAIVIVIAVVLARRAARRISAPFEEITAAARDLGAGRYQLGLSPWGIPEADAAGEALRESAAAIDDLVRHERDFVRHASHQLRTPLSGVLLALDQTPADVPAALAAARHLETTITDLVALRGVSGTGRCSAQEVAAESVARWRTDSREVSLRADHDADEVSVSTEALRQVLDVLLDNAFRHGSDPVTVTVEPHGDAVIVEVGDFGSGFVDGAQQGTGLRLATGIVERAGGSLLVRRRAPCPRVAVLLPQAADPGQSTSNR